MSRPRVQSKLGYLIAIGMVGLLTLGTAPLEPPASAPPEPERPERPEDNTFLTFPEWFLVYSPDEYATFIASEPPSEFPYFGHLDQLWTSYAEVSAFTKDRYPFNGGYHFMILVIGTSTTVEYTLKSAQELFFGRFTEATQSAMTPEDAFAARFARSYVDFLPTAPWYEYDFARDLKELWTEVPVFGPDPLRKLERRYALTQEIVVKTVYGELIKQGTKASFTAPVHETHTILTPLPPPEQLAGLEKLRVLESLRPEGVADVGSRSRVLVALPRYGPYATYAQALARAGADFEEIAGNRGLIVVSVLAPAAFQVPDEATYALLFAQPILTQPTRQRLVLVMPVASLGDTLRAFDAPEYVLEHVYDY